MHSHPHHPDDPSDDSLPPSGVEALRALPSEQAGLSMDTDAAVMAAARETLTAIRQRRLRLRLWPVLAVAACVVLSLTLLSRRNPTTTPEQALTVPEDPYAVILREVTSLFPHQVRAIKTDGGELQISLSEEPLADGAQAVVIEACGNGGCTVVITYVGQTVEIERQHVTIQADENGGITIIASQQEPAPDLQIKSRTI
jgi:hypothetical protein